MAAVELILLQRVEKLGQMGDVVKVKPGYARNFLLPQKKALRASKDNRAQFEQQRAQLEAQNIKRREEAERLAERVGGLSVVIIRQAGEVRQPVRLGVRARHRRSRHRRRPDHQPLAGRAGASDQDPRAVARSACRCIRKCRSRSPSTSPAARKKPNARPAANGRPAEADEDDEQAPTAENIFEGDTPHRLVADD